MEVCLGTFQVSFVDESTTDLVGCSVQAKNWTSVQGERGEEQDGNGESKTQKASPKTPLKYPDQDQGQE